MIMYNCARCDNIADLSRKEIYKVECIKCKAVGKWLPYNGPLAFDMLKKEDARAERITEKLVPAEAEVKNLEKELDAFAEELRQREFRYNKFEDLA
jgi:hypothetical protein